eukprot:2141360-Pleurochrysis_carterae.AAC.2
MRKKLDTFHFREVQVTYAMAAGVGNGMFVYLARAATGSASGPNLVLTVLVLVLEQVAHVRKQHAACGNCVDRLISSSCNNLQVFIASGKRLEEVSVRVCISNWTTSAART